MSEYDKLNYYFSLEFLLHEAFVRGTVDESQLLEMSENGVELLTNILPWTQVELRKRYLIFLKTKAIYDRFNDRCWDRNKIRI